MKNIDLKVYKMKIDQTNKEFTIDFSGFFTKESLAPYVPEFKNNIDSIICKDYHLILDGRKLSVFKQEFIPVLEECFEIYNATGFKKITMHLSENLACKIQLERIAKKVNLQAEII